MDSSFLNLVRGTRLSSMMGLQMEPEHAYKFSSDYCYVEIPILNLLLDGEQKTKALRNQYVFVNPACSITVRGAYRVQVEPNPKIAQFGIIQPGYYVHPTSFGDLVVPGFWFQARKDTDMQDMGYAVRMYLRA